MSIECLFITNLVPGKVEKENHIRKVWKSEERKVKNIGKDIYIIQLCKNLINQCKCQKDSP